MLQFENALMVNKPMFLENNLKQTERKLTLGHKWKMTKVRHFGVLVKHFLT